MDGVLDSLANILNTFVVVFFIVDPFAVIPVYLTLTERYSDVSVIRTRRKATWVALGVLSTFGLTGLSVFNLFGITLPAFQIAGGILLLLLGIAQLNADRARVNPEETDESRDKEDISIFPLGTPLLAGPGAISTVVLLSSQMKGVVGTIELLIAIVMALSATYLALKSAHFLFRWLGRTGLNLLTRIMGLILTAVAIQFIINGIKGAIADF